MRETVVIARRIVGDTLRAVAAARRELAWSLALLGGWSLVTLAVARIARPDVVWPVSGGVFLLACFGVDPLWRIVRHGLYTLTERGDA